MAIDASTSPRRAKEVSISQADLQRLQQGRLSFRTLSSGQLRCNQLPDLGRLSRDQVKRIHGQVASFSPTRSAVREWLSTKQTQPPIEEVRVRTTKSSRTGPVETIPEVYRRVDGSVQCPNCEGKQAPGLPYGFGQCQFCLKIFDLTIGVNPNLPRSALVKQALGFKYFNVACPRCQKWQYPDPPYKSGQIVICKERWCELEFQIA